MGLVAFGAIFERLRKFYVWRVVVAGPEGEGHVWE
jgi:hypothetical protein